MAEQLLGNIKGPKGDKGDTGATGPQGVQGEKGDPFTIYTTYATIAAMNADKANVPEGEFVMIASTVEDPDNAKLYVKGETDFAYITDLSGATGIQGPQGIQGIQGPDGVGIEDIQLKTTSGKTKTYEITLDDGSSYTFNVVDGADGAAGAKGDTGNGITSITKTGTSGLVDTYTIQFSGSLPSTTFNVTNGAKGDQGDYATFRVDSNGNLYVNYPD